MSNLFFNCDWGTTHLRLRLVTADDCEVRAQFQSDQGTARLAVDANPAGRPDQFRRVLETALRQLEIELGHPLPPAPVMISGMASSSIGWQEVPYARAPIRLDASDLIWQELPPVAGPGASHRVVLMSGLRTATDVIRGEETQAIGAFELLRAQPATAHSRLIMTGTHCKHLQVESGRITDFQTFMTGELFDVLSNHSILRHSIGVETFSPAQPPRSLDALRAGVQLAQELTLSAALFRVRTRQVLDQNANHENRSFLNGLLIGSELAYLANEAGSAPLLLAASEQVAESYLAALAILGLAARVIAISPSDVSRLSALGQACLLRHLQQLGQI